MSFYHLWPWHTTSQGWHRGPGCLVMSRVWLSRRSEPPPHSQPMGSWQWQTGPEHPEGQSKTTNFITSLVCPSPQEMLYGWIFHPNLVVLVGLKIRQWGVAGSGERHDFDPSVHQSFVVQLLEHPPKRKIKFKQRHSWEGPKVQNQ